MITPDELKEFEECTVNKILNSSRFGLTSDELKHRLGNHRASKLDNSMLAQVIYDYNMTEKEKAVHAYFKAYKKNKQKQLKRE